MTGSRLWSLWWPLVEGAVRPVAVVVVDVVDDEAFELGLVPDDGSVEEFAAEGADPAFGEAVGDWRVSSSARWLSPLPAMIFGLWHILPTLRTLTI